MFRTTQVKHCDFDLFYLVTSNDIDLTTGHSESLREYLEVFQTRFAPFHGPWFNRCGYFAGEATGDSKNRWQQKFDPTCDVISYLQIIFCSIFGKSVPGKNKYRFGSRIGPVVGQIAGGHLPNGRQGPKMPQTGVGWYKNRYHSKSIVPRLDVLNRRAYRDHNCWNGHWVRILSYLVATAHLYF